MFFFEIKNKQKKMPKSQSFYFFFEILLKGRVHKSSLKKQKLTFNYRC